MNSTKATCAPAHPGAASDPSTPRVLGYVRVSTTEQGDSGAGVAAQRAAIQAEADRRGWAVDWIEDAGYSARSMKRPGISDALARLRRGEADTLVVAKMDRLSRSLVDSPWSCSRRSAKAGLSWRSIRPLT